MVRDIDRLTTRTFDLLVVGGGIYGLTVAYDAAQRGLAVALIEREDFGSGASFNHLRTIHGGLRYLQTLNLFRAHESVRERRTLARIALHAVKPQLFALPLNRSLTKGKTAMRAGFALDRLVAANRNLDVAAHLQLPAGHVISRSETIERFPALRRQRLTGAAVWYDYVTPESDRLTFTFALAAAEHGAVLANYVEATMPIVERRRIGGVRAIDRQSGRELAIAARVTVNATGSEVDQLLDPVGAPTRLPMLKAMNLVTRREAGENALGGRSRSGRYLFLVPWRGRALFGTWESERPCDGRATVTPGEIAAFIADLNYAFPSLDLTLADVTLVHRGVVPARVGPDGRASLDGSEQVRDHAADGLDGLISVVGTKYTTARAVAERVTDLVLERLQHGAVPCRTAITSLPGGDARDFVRSMAETPPSAFRGFAIDTVPHLATAYGSRYRDVVESATDRPDWRSPLADDSPVIGAQLVWAVRQEMAVTLCDAAVRRTPLGAIGFPGQAAAARAAEIVGAELGWSADRKRKEIEAFERFYAPIRSA
jgi:glycerol-3-phosphate dehydrogenase